MVPLLQRVKQKYCQETQTQLQVHTHTHKSLSSSLFQPEGQLWLSPDRPAVNIQSSFHIRMKDRKVSRQWSVAITLVPGTLHVIWLESQVTSVHLYSREEGQSDANVESGITWLCFYLYSPKMKEILCVCVCVCIDTHTNAKCYLFIVNHTIIIIIINKLVQCAHDLSKTSEWINNLGEYDIFYLFIHLFTFLSNNTDC